MSALARRIVLPVMAAGLAGAMLPLSFGSSAAAEDPAFSGYSATTTASPVKLEIFEPTIPIPNSPQAEVEFGYTRVVADTSSARGRATFLWPGDTVGEGAKTIFENLGLPPEISGPLAAQGYPFQVNSAYPQGPEQHANQPFPGTVMYSRATEEQTIAEAGYSSQCELDTVHSEGGGGDSGGHGLPDLPDLPDLPGFPPLADLLSGQGAATGPSASSSKSSAGTGSSRFAGRAGTQAAAESAAAEENPCPIPPELAAVVSFGGYAAVSKTEHSTKQATSRSRAAVSDVSLLGGVVTFSGVSAQAVSTSDGAKPTGRGSATYGTISIGGEEFAIGPEGVEAGGQQQPIPGLPDDPKKALAELGITVTVPKPVYEQKGQSLKSTVEALIVTIDSKTFAAALRQLPLEDMIAQLPEDMKELKKFLQAVVNLSPKFVVHLAYTSSKINTVQPLEIPPIVPDNDPGEEQEEDTTEEDTESAGGGGTGSALGGSGSTGGTLPTTGSTDTGAEGAMADVALSSGLPPLFSIPTLLFVVALGGAAAAGSYLRRIGALTLGSGAACSHGLASGLPDLRRIQ